MQLIHKVANDSSISLKVAKPLFSTKNKTKKTPKIYISLVIEILFVEYEYMVLQCFYSSSSNCSVNMLIILFNCYQDASDCSLWFHFQYSHSMTNVKQMLFLCIKINHCHFYRILKWQHSMLWFYVKQQNFKPITSPKKIIESNYHILNNDFFMFIYSSIYSECVVFVTF